MGWKSPSSQRQRIVPQEPWFRPRWAPPRGQALWPLCLLVERAELRGPVGCLAVLCRQHLPSQRTWRPWPALSEIHTCETKQSFYRPDRLPQPLPPL